jgi:hypothetical protein
VSFFGIGDSFEVCLSVVRLTLPSDYAGYEKWQTELPLVNTGFVRTAHDAKHGSVWATQLRTGKAKVVWQKSLR